MVYPQERAALLANCRVELREFSGIFPDRFEILEGQRFAASPNIDPPTAATESSDVDNVRRLASTRVALNPRRSAEINNFDHDALGTPAPMSASCCRADCSPYAL